MQKHWAFVGAIIVCNIYLVVCAKRRGHIIIIGGQSHGHSVETKYVPIPVPLPMPCNHHHHNHQTPVHHPIIVKVPVPQIAYHKIPVFLPIHQPQQQTYQKIPIFMKENEHNDNEHHSEQREQMHSYDTQRINHYVNNDMRHNHHQYQHRPQSTLAKLLFWRNRATK